ncbi:unnamed protein product [Brassicogethes aeneus]|nr:unnamed protein product [Brassicogethes aeneus]
MTDDKVFMLGDLGCVCKVNLNDKDIKLSKIMNLGLSDNDKVVKIASGAKLFVAYSEEGYIFNNLNKLNVKIADVKDIKCGREHCLLLTKKGDIYSFGRGSRGQLGHGNLDDLENPLLLNALAGIKITQISCGDWHSCAVSDTGDLYVWGWNSNGQLGLKKSDMVAVSSTPCLVDFPGEVNVATLACGSRHTVVLLDNKKLFGAGWNKYKQLKDDEACDFFDFTYLHDFSEFLESTVVCGPWNTCVLCQ